MNQIPILKPIDTSITKCPDSVIFKISDIVANVMNSDSLLKRMVFTKTNVVPYLLIYEVFHSQA